MSTSNQVQQIKTPPTIERLFHIALTHRETAEHLVQLDDAVFSEMEMYPYLRDAIKWQLDNLPKSEPFELTRKTFERYLKNETNLIHADIVGGLATYNRVFMLTIKPSDAPMLFELLDKEHRRKEGLAKVRDGEFADGIAMLDKSGADVRSLEAKVNTQRLNKAGIDLERTLFTDVFNAEIFGAIHGDDNRYVAEWKCWMSYDGKRWCIDQSGLRARRAAIKLVRRDMSGMFAGIRDIEQQQRAYKHLAKSQSRNQIDAMLSLASTKLSISTSELDMDGWLFNVENGTIDLRDGTMRPHRREDLITKLAPVTFDASAVCPTWEAFIGDSIGADDIRQYVKRAVGYSMTADMGEKAMFILYGPSNTGKSTFTDCIKSIMGDYAMSGQQSLVLQTDKFKTNGEDEANLFGARYVNISEPGDGQRLDQAKMKRLVTSNGARILARRLFENSFEFAATHKLWIDANYRPTVNGGADDAVWNRIKLIPFDNIVPTNEQDTELHTKLTAEASGILNWMLKGLTAWREQGLNRNEPSAIRLAVNDYRNDSDTLGMFLRDSVNNNDAGKVETKLLYSTYQRWCSDNGMEHPMTQIALGRKLRERGYGSWVGNDARYTTGMELRRDGNYQSRLLSADDTDERTF